MSHILWSHSLLWELSLVGPTENKAMAGMNVIKQSDKVNTDIEDAQLAPAAASTESNLLHSDLVCPRSQPIAHDWKKIIKTPPTISLFPMHLPPEYFDAQ